LKHLRPKSRKQRSVDTSKLVKFLPNRRAVASILTSLFIVLVSIAVLLRIRAIGNGAHQLVTDGKRVFSPGELVSEQAYLGLVIAVICLAFIVVTTLFAGRRSSTVVMTAVMAAVSLTAVVFAFAAYQQYKGFLLIG
jgi:hypothetical protein